MKEFDLETLSTFNGKNGQPVYIAYKSKVIDVSESKMWKTGLHMKRHTAGHDLTADIEAAPHDLEVLDRYPQVGTLRESVKVSGFLPGFLEVALNRFPFLRRHPHPMLVHFPIVFMISPAFFSILYFITHIKSFETTTFQCLATGILFSIPAIFTGFFTWWVNYQAKPMLPIKIKIFFSILLMAVSVAAFIWRVLSPDLSGPLDKEGTIYFILIFSLFPIVTVISWYGATLTFPLEKK
ncbi:MAG: DUF2231 domain-containing protein [Syntrophales bacterium]|jgi:predicted heme/steroid binding protein/uncharacterized membrane protein